jgi:hypothetical protein
MNENDEIIQNEIANLLKRRASKTLSLFPLAFSGVFVVWGLIFLFVGRGLNLKNIAGFGRSFINFGAVLVIPCAILYFIFHYRYKALRKRAFSSRERSEKITVYLKDYLQKRDYKGIGLRDKGKAALDILSEEKCEGLADFLIQFYQEGKHEKTMRSEILGALEKTADIRTISIFIDALKDEDPSIRSQAAKILGNRKDERAVEPLTQLLSDENQNVRTSAAEALNKFKK